MRSRDGLTAYLQLVHDGRELSDDRFEALAAKRKLFPKLARRWRAFFKVKARQKDRVFAVWRAFEKATPKKYPSTVKSLLKHGLHPCPLSFHEVFESLIKTILKK